MKRNSRLALALHTLGHMARDPERTRKSADIAAHAGTNPVVVRRVLGSLREAGLLVSEAGHSGGWRLAHPPEHITLADVYLALDERIAAPDTTTVAHDCSVEHALLDRVTRVLSEVEEILIGKLSETTILEICEAAD